MFILEKLNIELPYLDKKATNIYKDKKYTFLLILPSTVIENNLNIVNKSVTVEINKHFIIPFAILSLCSMFIIAYFLRKISI